ncbi:MAG: hypothetical protein EVA59_13285 [Limnobacter sp.]|uniref:hypothetical protein n=1 Tax=Limnobacter sp. TaxID=2003368 RepID=UPI00121A82B5|nr:hypothetical protein [Limnobacter sp.]RZO91446.1 MAG: hypothetical protein EVA59_13285 [Limnobacter sp.]
MNTSRLEELLEAVVDKQVELIERLESIESSINDRFESLEKTLATLESHAFTIAYKAETIADEMVWWDIKTPTLASQLLRKLDEIETAVHLSQ